MRKLLNSYTEVGNVNILSRWQGFSSEFPSDRVKQDLGICSPSGFQRSFCGTYTNRIPQSSCHFPQPLWDRRESGETCLNFAGQRPLYTSLQLFTTCTNMYRYYCIHMIHINMSTWCCSYADINHITSHLCMTKGMGACMSLLNGLGLNLCPPFFIAWH